MPLLLIIALGQNVFMNIINYLSNVIDPNLIWWYLIHIFSRFWSRPRHLPVRLLPQGERRHAAHTMDGTRISQRWRLPDQLWCLVSQDSYKEKNSGGQSPKALHSVCFYLININLLLLGRFRGDVPYDISKFCKHFSVWSPYIKRNEAIFCCIA